MTEQSKSDVYTERNRLVALLASIYQSRIEESHDLPDEPDFNHVVYIRLSVGQVSWHVPDWDLELFTNLTDTYMEEYDGHNTDEKYKRVTWEYQKHLYKDK